MTNERLEQIRDSIDFQLSAEKNLKIDKEIILEEKELLDYITNLQEEIHKKEAMYDSLAVDYRLSQEENESLKELCDKYEEEHSTEFKIWKDERSQLIDYKSRNEKAIEYIKHYETIRGYYEYEENGYDEYNYDDDLKKNILELLEEVE